GGEVLPAVVARAAREVDRAHVCGDGPRARRAGGVVDTCDPAGRRRVVMLVLGWAVGGLAALPFARWARRETVAARIRPMRAPAPRAVPRLPVPLDSIRRVLQSLRSRRAHRRRDAARRTELPV